jgi:hypothetical protein
MDVDLFAVLTAFKRSPRKGYEGSVGGSLLHADWNSGGWARAHSTSQNKQILSYEHSLNARDETA